MSAHRSLARSLVLVAVIAATLSACSGGSSGGAAASPSGDPTKDKLAQVQARGTLVLWTDPDYAPQSMAVNGAARLSTTKCAPNQMTAPEMAGYDAETGKLVAAELGVEPCFVAVPFDQVIAGGWGDRCDVAWGSGAMTTDRMTTLYVTQPYYTTPANFFVKKDSAYKTPADLDGKQIGACSGCTHEQYLKRHPVPARRDADIRRRGPEARDLRLGAPRPRRRRRGQDRRVPVQPAGRGRGDRQGRATSGCSTRRPSTPTRPATSTAA